jgi:hypothetical protein
MLLPTGPALDHPAAPLLLQYATSGCPAPVKDSFPLSALEAAIARGAHPSATAPKAAAALQKEVQEKVAQGYARLITHPMDRLTAKSPHQHQDQPDCCNPSQKPG